MGATSSSRRALTSAGPDVQPCWTFAPSMTTRPRPVVCSGCARKGANLAFCVAVLPHHLLPRIWAEAAENDAYLPRRGFGTSTGSRTDGALHAPPSAVLCAAAYVDIVYDRQVEGVRLRCWKSLRRRSATDGDCRSQGGQPRVVHGHVPTGWAAGLRRSTVGHVISANGSAAMSV